MPEYTTRSYHLNVGAGDSAIHLLTKRSPFQNEIVESAVLIDGGPDFSYAVLVNCIGIIEDVFKLHADGKKGLRFDSVVVTHFDNDHYTGVFQLIREDFLQQSKNDPDLKGRDFECSYMYYDDDGRPLTRFYVPHFEAEKSHIGKSINKPHKSAPVFLTCENTKEVDQEYVDIDWEEYWLGMHIHAKPIQTMTPRQREAEEDDWNRGVAILIKDTGYDSQHREFGSLGKNLFEKYSVAHPKRSRVYTEDIQNPGDLWDTDDDTAQKENRPGLFIIGADGTLVGNDPLWTNGVGLVDEHSSLSNLSSIHCLIISSNGDPLHYFAGDAEWETEVKISDWFGWNGGDQNYIPAMKISHHGSVKNSPASLLTALKPLNIILSAGNKHYHPCHDLIQYLYALLTGYDQYFAYYKANHPPRKLYTTAYPYWTLVNPEWQSGKSKKKYIDNDFNVDIINQPNQSWKDFYEEMIHKWNWAGLSYNIYQSCKNYLPKPYGQGLYDLITDTAVDNFHEISGSGITADSLYVSHDNIQSFAKIRQFVPNVNQIHFILVTIANNKNIEIGLRKRDVQDAPTTLFTAVKRYSRKVKDQSTEPRRSARLLKKAKSDMEIEQPPPDEQTSAVISKRIYVKPTPLPCVDSKSLSTAGASLNSYFTPGGEVGVSPRINGDSLSQPSLLNDHLREPTPTPQAPDWTKLPEGSFYLLSSYWESLELPVEPPYVQLKLNEEYDPLVEGLIDGFIRLNEKPTSSTSFLQVHSDDEFLFWLRNSGLNASSMKVQVQYEDEAPKFDGIEIEIGLHTTKSGASPLQLTYSTKSEFINSAFEQHTIQENGLFASKNSGLVLALKNPTSIDKAVTLSTLISWLQTEYGEKEEKEGIATHIGPKLLELAAIGFDDSIEFIFDDSNGHKNAIWFQPDYDYKTDLRIQLRLGPDSFDKFKAFLGKYLKGVKMKSTPKVILRKTMKGMPRRGDISLKANEVSCKSTLTWSIALEIEAALGELSAQLRIRYSPDGMGFNLIFDSGTGLDDVIKAVSQWLPENYTPPSLGTWLEEFASSIKISLRSINLRIKTVESKVSIDSLDINLEISKEGIGAGKSGRATFLATFAWPKKYFHVSFWPDSGPIDTTKPTIPLPEPSILPEYEPLENLTPKNPSTVNGIPLTDLIPGFPTLPDCLSTELKMLRFYVSKDKTEFEATVGPPDKAVDSPIPMFRIPACNLRLTYKPGKIPETTIFISASTKLIPRDKDREMASLYASFKYHKAAKESDWTITARAGNIHMYHLYELFDAGGERDAVMNMLENIVIKTIGVEYQLKKDEKILKFDGVINVGALEMDLTYQKNSKKGDWKLRANARPASNQQQNPKISSLLGHIMDTASLPDIITNLEVPLSDLSGNLFCSKPENSKAVVFSMRISCGSLRISYAQMQDVTEAKLAHENGGTLLGNDDKNANKPIRLLKVSLPPFPKIEGIPLVDKVDQPFDRFEVVWLSKDINADQIALFNQWVFQPLGENLKFKEETGTAGIHFQVIGRTNGAESVILDYGAKQKAPKGKLQGELEDEEAVVDVEIDRLPRSSASEAPSNNEFEAAPKVSAPMKKSIGPLTISGIGLELGEDKVLRLTVTAAIRLGALGFSLLNFSLGLDLANLKSISDIVSKPPKLEIAGLAAEYRQPGVAISGLFEKTQGTESYSGGLIAEVKSYSFFAVGGYHVLTEQNMKSIFVFLKMRGLLFSIGAIDFTGICGGFGYNSSLRLPAVAEVQNFPFVNMAGDVPVDGDALTQLKKITAAPGPEGGQGGWIGAKADSIWIVAGLDIRAFQFLDVQALLALNIAGSKPNIGLVANAVATIPASVPGATKKPKFAYIELGVLATVDVETGTALFTAQLSERSFILDPKCKVTGGFALAYFGENSAYPGDWVATFGGYHPAYTPPSHYPVPPRLQFQMKYNDDFSITGQAYFAVTPAVCMGGGRLEALYQTSRTRVFFVAYADFLMNYVPFYFIGSCGVSLDVKVKIGIGILSTTIHVEVSADVKLKGPPMAGEVKVKIMCLSITILFGNADSEPPPLTLEEFVKKVVKSPGPDYDDHKITAEEGTRTKSGEEGVAASKRPNLIGRGSSLAFKIESDFPIDRYQRGGVDENPIVVDTKVFGRPMKSPTPLVSKLSVSIQSQKNTSYHPEMRWQPIYSELPVALFDQYDRASDPAHGSRSLLETKTVTAKHFTGFKIAPMPPTESNENLPAYNLSEFSMDSVAKSAVPALKSANPAFNPGESHGTLPERINAVKGLYGEKASALRKLVLKRFLETTDPYEKMPATRKKYGRLVTMEEPKLFVETMQIHRAEAPRISV